MLVHMDSHWSYELAPWARDLGPGPGAPGPGDSTEKKPTAKTKTKYKKAILPAWLAFTTRDVHFAGFCGYPWAATPGLLHHAILIVLAWKNAMGAMAKRCSWQKGTLGNSHGVHGKKGHDNPERNPFRAVRCCRMMNSHCSSWFIMINHLIHHDES